MKKAIYALAASAILFTLTSCVIEKRHASDGSLNGDFVSRSEAIKPFSELYVSGYSEIIFTQGPTDSVRIEASKELVDLVTIEQDGETLSISKKNSPKKINLWGSDDRIFVYLASPNLVKLNLSGANDFTVKDSLLTDNFDVVIAGAGDLKINKLVASNSVTVSVSGAGDADMDYLTAKSFTLNMSGAGDVDAKIHDAQTVKVGISGAGDADLDLYSCGDVYVRTSGAADVTLKGDAETFDFSKSGAGSVDHDKLKVANPNK